MCKVQRKKVCMAPRKERREKREEKRKGRKREREKNELCTGIRRKMPWEHLRNQKDPTDSILKGTQMSTFHLRKESRETITRESPPKGLGSPGFILWYLAIQAFIGHCSYNPKGLDHASTNSRHWHHPCGAGFTAMLNARVVGPRRLSIRFEGKALQVRAGVLETRVYEAVIMKQRHNGDPRKLETTGMWNMSQGKPQGGNGVSLKEKIYGLPLARLWGKATLLCETHILPPCAPDARCRTRRRI